MIMQSSWLIVWRPNIIRSITPSLPLQTLHFLSPGLSSARLSSRRISLSISSGAPFSTTRNSFPVLSKTTCHSIFRSTYRQYSTHADRSSAKAASSISLPLPDLPASYDPDVGLPLPRSPLSQTEVNDIFGQKLPVPFVNKILRIQHGRRIAGFISLSEYKINEKDQHLLGKTDGKVFLNKGLQWLRKTVPIDEKEAERRMLELARREATDQITNEQGGDPQVVRPNEGEGWQQKGTRRSIFAELKEKRERREKEEKEAEEKAKETMEKVKRGEPVALEPYKLKALEQQAEWERKQEQRKKYWEDKALITKDTEPPKMKATARIAPTTALLALLVASSMIFVQAYEAPSSSERIFPGTPPAAATILAIIGLNAAVWLAWKMPPFWNFLSRYFLHIPGYPFALSALGNVFSHQSFLHLARNMTVLWLFGGPLHAVIGRGAFLGLYTVAGTMGSTASLVFRVLRNDLRSTSLGASGAVCGIIAAYCVIRDDENRPFTLAFLPPEAANIPSIPPLSVLYAMIALDVSGLLLSFRRAMKADYMAHLGGTLAGVLGAWIILSQQKHAEEKGLNDNGEAPNMVSQGKSKRSMENYSMEAKANREKKEEMNSSWTSFRGTGRSYVSSQK